MILSNCPNCDVKTDTGGKCRKCQRLCKRCEISVDQHTEGMLHKCLLELSK